MPKNLKCTLIIEKLKKKISQSLKMSNTIVGHLILLQYIFFNRTHWYCKLIRLLFRLKNNKELEL